MVKGTNEMQQKEVLMDQIEEEREKLNLLLDGDEISETAYGPVSYTHLTLPTILLV